MPKKKKCLNRICIWSAVQFCPAITTLVGNMLWGLIDRRDAKNTHGGGRIAHHATLPPPQKSIIPFSDVVATLYFRHSASGWNNNNINDTNNTALVGLIFLSASLCCVYIFFLLSLSLFVFFVRCFVQYKRSRGKTNATSEEDVYLIMILRYYMYYMMW